MQNVMELMYMSRMCDAYAQQALFDYYRGFIKYLVLISIRPYRNLDIFKEDLEQEAWLGFVKALETFRSDNKASFTTFMALIVKRKIWQEIAKIRRHDINFICETKSLDQFVSKTTLYSELLPQRNQLYEPEYYTNYMELKEKLDTILDGLSDKEKEIYECWINGDSYAEAAEKLNIPKKTFDGRKSRLRKKIYGQLLQNDEE